MKTSIDRFLSDQSAVSAIEYALLAGLIAVAIVTSVTVAGTHLLQLWDYVKTEVIKGTS